MCVWGGVIENESVVRDSTISTHFALIDNGARGAILHVILATDAKIICGRCKNSRNVGVFDQ